MSIFINRRDFLKKGLLAAAAFSTFPLVRSWPGQAPSPKKVIIAGAGLGGLASAYLLTRHDHEVIVLEARNRVGGRIETFRQPFSEGLFAEAGAFFISDQHKLATRYITEICGLSLAPILPAQAPTLYYLQDHQPPMIEISPPRGLGSLANELGLSHDDPLQAWQGFDLTDDEKKLGLFRFRSKYFGVTEPRVLGKPEEQQWPPASLMQYDKMDCLEYLKRQGASSSAINLLRPWLDPFLDEFDKLSALGIYREAALARTFGNKDTKWFTVQNGMDEFPQKLVAKLKPKTIRPNSRVVEIRQEPKGVIVTYVDLSSGASLKETADHLICTVPFSVLRHIKVTPPFSPAKQKAIEELPHTSIARVYLQCNERLWAPAPEHWKGVVFTDLPIGAVIDSTAHIRDKTSGILHSYVSGNRARSITAMKESDRINYLVEELEKIFPGIRKSFEADGRRGASKCWDEDEWAKGAYAYFKPGQMFDLMPHLATPEWQDESVKRVHFAGDHTSRMPGWMEGALASGHRAAREIDPSVQPSI